MRLITFHKLSSQLTDQSIRYDDDRRVAILGANWAERALSNLLHTIGKGWTYNVNIYSELQSIIQINMKVKLEMIEPLISSSKPI